MKLLVLVFTSSTCSFSLSSPVVGTPTSSSTFVGAASGGQKFSKFKSLFSNSPTLLVVAERGVSFDGTPPPCFISVGPLVVLFVLSCRRLFGMFFKADKEGDDIGVMLLKM